MHRMLYNTESSFPISQISYFLHESLVRLFKHLRHSTRIKPLNSSGAVTTPWRSQICLFLIRDKIFLSQIFSWTRLSPHS